MATNTLRPTYLRTGVSTQVAATVVTPIPVTGNSVTNQQTVYEWMDFSSQWKTNPHFLKGTAGTTLESIHVAGGGASPRILRGYIRRAEYSLNDDASMSRLYFMYNPEQISRDYMNYLDQGALDPFNTVFQSGNLVAPPSMLNFNFEIFFDRQEEAQESGNRGVMVDMDYFDLVVRNVKPGSGSTNATLPDNGVMMVNPRDITVVFSPEITVQGRPLNASVTYERFTYKMVPTRMRINLQMRVVYFGPQRDITTFVPETVRAMESIPFPVTEPVRYTFDYSILKFDAGSNEGSGGDESSGDGGADDGSGSAGPVVNSEDLEDVLIPAGEEEAFIRLNMEAMAHGWKRAFEEQPVFLDIQEDGGEAVNHLQYGKIPHRGELWQFCDCSSFVWACFAELGLSSSLGWAAWNDPHPDLTLVKDYDKIVKGVPRGNIVDTSTMHTLFSSGNPHARRLWGFPSTVSSGQYKKIIDNCISGDILLRAKTGNGHVGMVWKIEDGKISVMHAGSPSKDIYMTTITSSSDISYNCAVRPHPHHS